jgi:hypothetical protein
MFVANIDVDHGIERIPASHIDHLSADRGVQA